MIIELRKKYRTGIRYKSQESSATPNGGDAFLQKHLKRRPIGPKEKARLKPAAHRAMTLLPTGKVRFR